MATLSDDATTLIRIAKLVGTRSRKIFNTAVTCTPCPSGTVVASGSGTQESDCTCSKLIQLEYFILHKTEAVAQYCRATGRQPRGSG